MTRQRTDTAVEEAADAPTPAAGGGARPGSAVAAMVVKEFRQLRRDRRTVAMMVFLPILLLVVFGYAARFTVPSIPTTVVGPGAAVVAGRLPAPFTVAAVAPAERRADAERALRDGVTPVAVVAGPAGSTVLIDGSQLFVAQTALRSLAEAAAGRTPIAAVHPVVLYNPELKASDVMVPGLAALILLFIGTVVTSVGVVRERQAGTLEQLAVMPLRPTDVFLGKIAPYFVVAALDMVVVVATGVALFHVPFRGSVAAFALGAVLFLFVTLGLGVLISSVSQNQGQAIQLAIMVVLPQVMLSGLIFPLSSMAPGVRWIGYALPQTYFVQIARGIMLRGAPLSALWEPFVYLAALGAVVLALATLRFRRTLAPAATARHATARIAR